MKYIEYTFLIVVAVCVSALETADYNLEHHPVPTTRDILESHRQSHALKPNRDAVEQQIEYLMEKK